MGVVQSYLKFKVRNVNPNPTERKVEDESTASTTPSFSIIIAVYNDWGPLDHCLQSLCEQINGPSFEVIVVDDGSETNAPGFIADWDRRYPLSIVRQPHAGISAARNRGIHASRGSVLVFADADCKFQPNCLAALDATMSNSPQHDCFQLRLIGDGNGLVGRAEQLRLLTIQGHMLLRDGCIRYLNTAGFAIRRTQVDVDKGLFDQEAERAEDTFLLAKLIEGGVSPWFAKDAVVQHAIPLSLMECLRKDIHTARMEARTYEIIDLNGVKLRITNRERFSLLFSMWKTSAQRSIGHAAWFVVVARQGLRWVILSVDRCFRGSV
jgi:glycosyltransferase involved in cell wall biosynthesis